jgi:hypothetical protein
LRNCLQQVLFPGKKCFSYWLFSGRLPVACRMAMSSRVVLSWSRPVTVSQRLTGVPAARDRRARPAAPELLLRCHSRTSWKPQPATERISGLKMEVMIAEFMSDFSLSLKRAGSEIADLEPFSRWRIDPQEIPT